jgi:hypothetical protein
MKVLRRTLFLGVVFCAFIAGVFSLWAHKSQAKDTIVWGVDYSDSQAEYLGLSPTETYSAIIHDLSAKNIKIHVNWDTVEKTKGTFDFAVLDREVGEAERNHVKLILVIGMKTGRWPECHAPLWFDEVEKDKRQAELLRYVTTVVARYKNSKAVEYWQIENEPLLRFGECPSWYYAQGTKGLQAEVDAVKSVDTSRKIIISDSGELSTWTTVAPIADIVGITMYRSTWNGTQKTFGLNPYAFLSPEFYSAKASFIEKYYDKPVISVELQAEPWASKPLAQASVYEQEQSMNAELFDENVTFAKQTGLQAFYFWGAEWWYFMKVKHNSPDIWDKATQLFAEQN